MIVVTDVHAKGAGRPKPILDGVSIRWERGILAIIGAAADGTSLLLECLAGRSTCKRGSITIDDRPAAQGRLDVVHVPLEPVLPESLRVDEVVRLAAELRREPPAALEPLGLRALAERRVSSLSPPELRAVALALAVGSRATTLLIEEPLSRLEPTAPAHVTDLLRARAASGASIIVTTASVKDATTLDGSMAVLTRGRLQDVSDVIAHRTQLRVVASGPAEGFVAALRADEAVTRVDVAGGALTVSGDDLVAVAAAVARVAATVDVVVEVLEPAVSTLDEIRFQLAGLRS